MEHRQAAESAVEAIARASYGRLVAYLCARTRDLASAEDALGEALVAALASWPREGVPRQPEAWLLAVARHRLIDRSRHEQVKAASEPTLRLMTGESTAFDPPNPFPDERLKLLFVCAHPAIDRSVRTPLMLQTVLGLDAARIAPAFLVAPKAMAQRLVRAKTKIRDAGIPFEVPEHRELPGRLDAVLEAIYAAYGIGWDDVSGVDPRGRGLVDEAIWLTRVLASLMPDEPEVRGLLALMLHSEARRPARRTADGRYVPLSEQDPRRWSARLIHEAERHLTDASRAGRPGRFQLEAAIQSAHAERLRSGRPDWAAIVLFYDRLLELSATLGARVARAAAVGEARGPETGLAALAEIDLADVERYQPYWAVRAHLLQRLGRTADAAEAFDRAIGLAEDPAIRSFLHQKRA